MSKKCRVCNENETKGNAESCKDCRDFDKIAQNVWGNRKRREKVDRKDFPKIGDLARHIKKLYYAQKGCCHYTGYDMALPIKDKKYVGLGRMCSPDRKRADTGYTQDNIVLCLDKINIMKTNLTSEDEFYTYCKAVTNHFESKNHNSVQQLSKKQIEDLVKDSERDRY